MIISPRKLIYFVVIAQSKVWRERKWVKCTGIVVICRMSEIHVSNDKLRKQVKEVGCGPAESKSQKMLTARPYSRAIN